jgi:hypothetical protein
MGWVTGDQFYAEAENLLRRYVLWCLTTLLIARNELIPGDFFRRSKVIREGDRYIANCQAASLRMRQAVPPLPLTFSYHGA